MRVWRMTYKHSTLSLSHTHTESLSLSLTLSHTHTQSLSLSLTHTHTHTHRLSLSHSLSHTHTQSKSIQKKHYSDFWRFMRFREQVWKKSHTYTQPNIKKYYSDFWRFMRFSEQAWKNKTKNTLSSSSSFQIVCSILTRLVDVFTPPPPSVFQHQFKVAHGPLPNRCHWMSKLPSVACCLQQQVYPSLIVMYDWHCDPSIISLSTMGECLCFIRGTITKQTYSFFCF